MYSAVSYTISIQARKLKICFSFFFWLLLLFIVDSTVIINISLTFIMKEKYIAILEREVETCM